MTAEPLQGFERANWRGLVAVIASSLIIGVGLGGATPLLSLKMEAWGAQNGSPGYQIDTQDLQDEDLERQNGFSERQDRCPNRP